MAMSDLEARRWRILCELPRDDIYSIWGRHGKTQPSKITTAHVRKALLKDWDDAVCNAVIMALELRLVK